MKMNSQLKIFFSIMIVFILLILTIVITKKKLLNNYLYGNGVNINESFTSNQYHNISSFYDNIQLKTKNPIRPNNNYTNYLDLLPLDWVIKNNPQLHVMKVENSLTYQGNQIFARRKSPIYYEIYSSFSRKAYQFYRYPDFMNEEKRHQLHYMNSYIQFLYRKLKLNSKNNQNNYIFEFTCFHGVLDNKIRLWRQLVKTYGRKVASQVMPESYLIPDDYELFKNKYGNGNGNGNSNSNSNSIHKKKIKFILKNAHKGGKSGLKVTNSTQYILDCFQKTLKDTGNSLQQCPDTVCLGKIPYNVIQPYLEKPFLIYNYKFNFRFFLTIFWKDNVLTAGIYRDFYLSYSNNKYQSESTNFNDNITSIGDNHIQDTIQQERPNNYETFKKFLDQENLSYSSLISKIRSNIYKVVASNKKELTQYCLPNQNHFQIYALDMEMDEKLNPVLYEANVYFSLYYHIYGKIQSSLYEDIFNYFKLTDAFNYGFWEVYPNYN